MKNKIARVAVMSALLVLTGCPQNGTPVLASVTPSTIPQGSAATTLLLRGANFAPPAAVTWTEAGKSVSLAATLVSGNEITAVVPADELEASGSAQVKATVGTNQTATASLSITISPAPVVVPTVALLAPAHVVVGSGFTMTVTGTGFTSASYVQWDAQPTGTVPTTFVSSTQLTAAVPASIVQTPGTSSVTVVTPGASGGTSNAALVTKVGVLSVSTSTLPGGTVGAAYTATLAATGGTAPYTWTLTSGTLPAGLSLATTGVISGTPTGAGSASFTVTVTDSTGTLAI